MHRPTDTAVVGAKANRFLHFKKLERRTLIRSMQFRQPLPSSKLKPAGKQFALKIARELCVADKFCANQILFALLLFCLTTSGCSLASKEQNTAIEPVEMKALILNTKAESSAANGDLKSSVKYFEEEIKLLKGLGAFKTSSRKISLKYAKTLGSLAAINARLGKSSDALELWEEAQHIFRANGVNRAAVYMKREQDCQIGMTLCEANRLLFEQPLSRQNPTGSQINIYNYKARKKIPFLLPLSEVALCKINELHFTNQYPWIETAVIDHAEVIKFLRCSDPKKALSLVTIADIEIPTIELDNFPQQTKSKLTGATVVWATGADKAFEFLPPFPKQNFDRKKLEHFRQELLNDDSIDHNVSKEFPAFLEDRWNSARINEFCAIETRNLGLRACPLTPYDTLLTGTLFSNENKHSSLEPAWSVGIVNSISSKDILKPRPARYLLKARNNRLDWIIDYANTATKGWNSDDYIMHRIESILINCLDAHRALRPNGPDFLVSTEADLSNPYIDRSLSLLNNWNRQVIRNSAGFPTAYTSLLPPNRKLEVFLDQRLKIKSIHLEGTADTIWIQALDELEKSSP